MGRTENSTERLQASRGHRHWAKEIRRSQTLFGVSGEVRSKNNLTEPALLEMSGDGVNRPSAATVCFDYFIQHGFGITSISPTIRELTVLQSTASFFQATTQFESRYHRPLKY
jgi:hypothetical protein